ncbi:hypothetical protein HWV62_30139 [Athelia sp. TMB]|nr:hypothetical protein HWV62_30139 [Athelia sp. TMB]
MCIRVLMQQHRVQLHRIEDQTDSMFFMMTAKRVHDSIVKSGITGSEEVYNLFKDQYNLDPFDILRDFQLYALRKPVSIPKVGERIPMRYTSYDVDIVEKHHIKIIGWPAEDVRFVKPANMTPKELRKIIRSFKTGVTYWRPLTTREKKKVEDDAKKRDAGAP